MKQINNYVVRNLYGILSQLKWIPTTLLLFLMMAYSIQGIGQPGRAPVASPLIGFGIDGDGDANTYSATPSFSNTGDWFNYGATGTGTSLFDMSDVNYPYTFAYYPSQSYHYEDPWDGVDPTILTGSTKVHDPYGITFTWGPGQNPNKNEINNAVVHFTFGSNQNGLTGNPSDLWCVFAADRRVNNGDAYIDFEFLQSTLTMVTNPNIPTQGWFESEGPDGTRTVGDILVTIKFTQGGNTATPVIHKWLSDGNGGFDYFEQDLSLFAGAIYLTSNTVAVTPLWQPYGQTSYDLNQFAEGAINLSFVMGIGEDECGLLSTVFVRTKTSQSPTAELKDFPGVPYQINICNDQTPPVIADIPDINLIGCNPDWPSTVTTTWTDNCTTGGTLEGVPGDVVTTGCTQYRDYTFNVTDDCGNDAIPVTVRVTRTYDVTPPAIVYLPDYSLTGCNTAWPSVVSTTWTDNCTTGGSINGVAGDVVSLSCSQYRDYTFNVSDACGNPAIQQTTRVTRTYDITPPVIVDLPDYSLTGCNTAWPSVVSTTWSDNCTTGGSINGVAGDVVTLSCSQYRDYTFNVSDACGNPAIQQTTRVTRTYDITPPVIVDLPDYSLTGCNTAWPSVVSTTWSDNCTTGGSINGVAGDVVTLSCSQYRDYTFNVSDACGNPAIQQTTRVTRTYDITPPVIVDLPDYSLTGCNTAWPSVVSTTWSDNCTTGGSINGVAGDVVTLSCSQYRDYTFNVSDACGNPATQQTTRVTRTYDITPPVIVDLPDYSLTGCNTAWPSVVSTTWSDNCTTGGSINGVAGDVVSLSCSQYRDYTFNVSDACGNPAIQQTTRVTRTYDITPPVIVDLPDYSLTGCNTAWPSVVSTTWTDNCTTGGSINGVAGSVITLSCSQYRDYTFNVSDACGNPATQQTTRVTRTYDITPPVIVDLPDYSLTGCNTAWPSVVSTTWSDNCTTGGSINGVAGDVVTLSCSQYRDYTFNVSDACGNPATQQTTRVTRTYDITPPVIVDLPDYSLTGCNTAWPSVVSTTWSDNCTTGGSINGVAGDVVTLSCSQYRDYTFNVSDACGNPATQQTTRVTRTYDITPPVIVDLPDYSLTGCNTAWPSVVSTTWSDNCTTGGSINGVAGDVVTLSCSQYRDYTFNVSDACGNPATQQTTRVTRTYDITPPVIVDLPDYSLTGCNTAWPSVVSTTWSDNCTTGGSINGVAGDVVTLSCSQYRDYTFTVSDACGNPAIQQTTRVTRTYDITPPVIVDLPDYSLPDCNAEWPSVVTTTWSDNCTTGGSINGVAGDVITEGCTQYRDYTFNVSDNCGNHAVQTTTRVTRIYDVTDPVLTNLPEGGDLGCDPEFLPSCDESVGATDNCGDAIVECSAGYIIEDGNNRSQSFTYVATDACGNDTEEVVTYTWTTSCGLNLCTLTQGFYGNLGGDYCDGTSTIDLLNMLLSTDLTIGTGTRSIVTHPVTGPNCVINTLPAGGQSSAIAPGGPHDLCSLPATMLRPDGSLKNNLIAQTLTMGLNLRLDTDLGDLELESRYFFTRASSDCYDPDAYPLIGTELYYTLPTSVMTVLGADNAVSDLYMLANRALGGEIISGCSLGDITTALGIINTGLDKCRFIYFCTVPCAPVTSPLPGGNTTLTRLPNNNEAILAIVPNPFSESAEIRYTLTTNSRISLEVYNLYGTKVATLFEGEAKAGFDYTYRFDPVGDNSEQVFLVVLRTDFGTITKRIINTY